jgi:hypothetical protein
LGNGPFTAIREIIEDEDFVAAIDQLFGDDAADKAGATGDEDALGHGFCNSRGAGFITKDW